MSYFPPHSHSRNKIEVKSDFSNYITKSHLKIVSQFTKKDELADLKSEVNKLGIDKMENVPSGLNILKSKVDKLDVDEVPPASEDLSKLSDVVKMKFLKRQIIMLRSRILKIKYLLLLT